MSVLTPEQTSFVLGKLKYALANIPPAETVAADTVSANSTVAQNATVAEETTEAAPVKKVVAQEAAPAKKFVDATAEAYNSSGGRRKRTKRVKRTKRAKRAKRAKRGTRR